MQLLDLTPLLTDTLQASASFVDLVGVDAPNGGVWEGSAPPSVQGRHVVFPAVQDDRLRRFSKVTPDVRLEIHLWDRARDLRGATALWESVRTALDGVTLAGGVRGRLRLIALFSDTSDPKVPWAHGIAEYRVVLS